MTAPANERTTFPAGSRSISRSWPYRLAVLTLIVAGHVLLAFSVVPIYTDLWDTISTSNPNELLRFIATLPLLVYFGAMVAIEGYFDEMSEPLMWGGWACLSVAGFLMGIPTRWLPYWIERVVMALAFLWIITSAFDNSRIPPALGPLLLLLPVVYVLTRDAWFGGSPVRQLLGTRVVTHRGRVKLWQSVVRNLPLCVPVLPWICLWQLFIGKPTRFGERMSRTWVVRRDALKNQAAKT